MSSELMSVVATAPQAGEAVSAGTPAAGPTADGAAAAQPFDTLLQQHIASQQGAAPEAGADAKGSSTAATADGQVPDGASDSAGDAGIDELPPEVVEALIQQLLAGNLATVTPGTDGAEPAMAAAAGPDGPVAAAVQPAAMPATGTAAALPASPAVDLAAGLAGVVAAQVPAPAAEGIAIPTVAVPEPATPTPVTPAPAANAGRRTDLPAKQENILPADPGVAPKAEIPVPAETGASVEENEAATPAGVQAAAGKKPPAGLQARLAEVSAQVVSSDVSKRQPSAAGQSAQAGTPQPAAKAAPVAPAPPAAPAKSPQGQAHAPAAQGKDLDVQTPAPAVKTGDVVQPAVEAPASATAGSNPASGPETTAQISAGAAAGNSAAGPEAARHQPSAPPASDGGPVVNRQEVMEQVVRFARLGLERGQSRFEMRLEPPSLGRVGVVMDLKDGSLNITFRAETAAVREALQNSLPQLRESLSAQGLNLGGCDVQGFGRGGRQQGEPGLPAGPNFPPSSASAEDGEGVTAELPAGRGRSDGGVLDYWA